MHSALSSTVPADQVAKSVLLYTEDVYLLAVLPANHRIMLSDLTAEFGRRPQLVEEDRRGFIFNDCDRGAIPALASGYDIPLIVDDNLDRQPAKIGRASSRERECQNVLISVVAVDLTKIIYHIGLLAETRS